jgi:DNA-binding protein HU-beta
MTKAELVARIAAEANVSKKAAAAGLMSFVGAGHGSLKAKGGQIRIADMGTFVSSRKLNGVNPQTRKKIKIPASKVARFRPAKALKEAVKKAK